MISKKYLLPIFLITIQFSYLQSGSFLEEDKLIELAGSIKSQPGKIQVEQEIEYIKSKENYSLLYELDISYGFNDKLGIQVTIPVFIKRKVGPFTSNGLSNIFVELEWTFFERESNLALFMFGVALPSGSKDKIPPIESGSVGAIFEFNAIHADDRWYAQTDWGAIINSQRKHDTKIGNLYFYNLLGGPRFKINPCSLSTYFFLLTLSGFYSERNKFRGIVLDESGSSLVLLGPLVSWTRKNLLAQALLQFPIGQHVFGSRPKVDLRAGFSFQFTF